MTTQIPFRMIDPASLASQSDAETGVADDKVMTPLRVAQAVAALAGNDFKWSDHAEFYTTPYSSGEQSTSLPMGNVRKVIFTVGPIQNISTDDLIIAFGEAEFTLESGVNTMVASALIIGTADYDTTPISGGEITEFNARNITANMHHDVHVKVGALRSPINSGVGVYVNFVSYADSSGTSQAVTVEQDYGRLCVLVLKDFFKT